MLITDRRIAYAVAMMMALTAGNSGVVYAEDSQSVVKESAPAVDASKLVPQAGAEQKKVSAGQVSDILLFGPAGQTGRPAPKKRAKRENHCRGNNLLFRL
jgi:hypothetical protein